MGLKDHREELIDGFTKAVDEMIRAEGDHPNTQGQEPLGVKAIEREKERRREATRTVLEGLDEG